MGWPVKRLGDLCQITSSKRIYASDYRPHGVPFYRGKEIIEKHKGEINVSTKLFISEEKFSKIRDKFGAPQCGDILLTSVGTLGVPYVVRQNEKFYFKDGNLIWFKNFKDVRSDFLSNWLLSPSGKAELKKATIGASQSAFTIVLLKDLEIALPPLQIQGKVASILSSYDDLIENNARRIKLLEELARLLYREWFVRFRYPGHETVPLVESELGPIPQGWEVAPVKELCESVSYGYTAKSTISPVGPKFLRITDIVPPTIDWATVPHCEISTKKEARYLLSQGDIVVARTGATTGFAKRINRRNPQAVFASYLVKFQVKSEYSNLMVGIAMESPEYKAFIKTNMGGAAQPNANAQVLGSYPIPVPPPHLRIRFDAFVEKLIDLKELLEVENSVLRETRDLLLPRLVSGEVDVSELDIDVSEVGAA